jgi:hypothetical protein
VGAALAGAATAEEDAARVAAAPPL